MIVPAAAAVLLLGLTASSAAADGLYSKNSPVLQLNAQSYNTLVAQSNHTSIVEFYAPWCGHCQNLKPAYEKAAKSLAGLAKVAAVNCDDEDNKPFCGSFGVKGFPTLKIVRPGKKRGKPIVEDYQGPREAKAIVDAVVERIPNHVKRLKDADVEEWLDDTTAPQAKAILFTEKGTTSALIRSLAVDFLGSIRVAQIRSTEKVAVAKFGIERFPSIVLLPGDGQDPIVYTDEMKKQALVDFLSQVAPPNPDPAPKKAKASSAKPAKKSSTAPSPAASDFDAEHVRTIVLDDDTPGGTPLPFVEKEQAKVVPEPEPVAPIPTLATSSELEEKCIAKKSGTCILVLLPSGTDPEAPLPESAASALNSLAEIADKHSKRKDHTFPFYSIPAENERASAIRAELGLGPDSDLEILALNNKRGWWRQYAGDGYDIAAVETFVDSIKLGEGPKQKLPDGFKGQEDATEAEEAAEAEAESKAEAVSETEAEAEAEVDPSASAVPESEAAKEKETASAPGSEAVEEEETATAPVSEAADEEETATAPISEATNGDDHTSSETAPEPEVSEAGHDEL